MPAPATNKQSSPQEQFSKRVKKRLVELELTVTDVAKELGINRNTVSRAIHHDMYQPTRELIASFLKLPKP
jgi:transposase-like protein